MHLQAAPTALKERLKNKRNWLAAGAALAAVAVLAAVMLGRRDPPQYFTAKVEVGDIHDVVDVTGTVNPVTTVQVGSQVSGSIAKLNADFNSRVHKGEVIAEIDPALFRGALLQATADLDSAKANVVKAQSAVAQTKADYERNVTLAKQGIVSSQALDLAKANYDQAVASTGVAQAEVNLKVAAVDVARTNLDYTVIRSPIDGTVVARNVDVGQTVAASLQAPTLFTIAQDLRKMQVYAVTDESDVGNVHVGRSVTFKVDAFPKDIFHGEVSQVRMNPTTVQNVVTYNAIVDFDNPDLKLFPGMTAYLTIPVADAIKVLRVPNADLRFKPQMDAAELQALYDRYGIVDQGASHRSADTAVVWKLHGDELEPVQIALGITDHAYTALLQVIKGALKEGDVVVTGMSVAKSGPGAPGAPVRR
jgi:HlyD family secretion protein